MELNYAFIESATGQNMYQYAITTLFNDNQGISGMLRTIGSLLSNVCSIFLYAGIIASLDFKVMLILIATSTLHLIVLRKLLNKQHSKKDFWVDIDRKTNYLFSYIQNEKNNKDIKMFSMQGWLSKAADLLIHDRLIWVKKLAKYNLFAAISDIVLLIIRDGFAYFFIFQAILNNRIEISQFVFYFGAITGFSAFVTGLTNDFAYISKNSKEVTAFRDYLEIDTSYHTGQAQYLPSGDPLCIELINLSFRLEKESPYILKNINLKINKGEKVALIGENGAGKTTLIKLLCGFYKPTEGKILINGIDSSELSQSCIGSLFATVFQDIHILPMSVAENIAFDDADKKTEEIKHCIRIAGLDDVFSDIHMPITKMLHKEGIILSGGQEQKLILARAAYKILYQNASALILDEPTAALDPIAEKQFYERYQTLANGKTSIFISHRLASTQFCDRIVVLDSGKIVETGTHSQLIASGGKYNEHDIQSRYYK
jgi:ATP-binding cassette subfamily B protein